MKHGRLIDADALIAEYDMVHIGKPGGARKLMVDAPTIEERKTGKWRYSRNISSISYSDMMITCDQCGYTKERSHGDVLNFCPNCGADMRERREEHEQNRK